MKVPTERLTAILAVHTATGVTPMPDDEVAAALSELLELREAVKPFAALAARMDASAVQYLRTHQAEAAASMTDAELAALEFPDTHAIVSSGDMHNPTLVTMGDFRRAARSLQSHNTGEPL